MKKGRLIRIDIMVGLAMLLVVLGHFSVGFEPDWYSNGLHNWIYSFHMEMFIFLSAFLIRYTYKGVESLKEYGKYIWRKFKKFFVWFIIVGIAVALIACVVKDKTLNWEYVGISFKKLFLYPRWSEASFLWYIYILFGYYLVSPLFFRLPQIAQVICCIGAMFIAMLDGNTFLASHEFCQYTFFYCLGVLCAQWIEEIRNVKLWLWGLLSVPFLAFTGWVFSEGITIGFQFPQLGWWTTVTGVAALPFFYLLSMALEKTKFTRALFTSISVNCYWIYLLQMFIIWGCARLVHSAIHIGTISFIPFFIVTTILAIGIPIALAELTKKFIVKKK